MSENYQSSNVKLKEIGLFDLHYRIVNKMCIFVYKIFVLKKQPFLVNELNFNHAREIQYDLRNKNKLTVPLEN